MEVPAIRVYEDIICHHYYDNLKGSARIGLLEDIDEGLCKGDEVQNQLNILLAGYNFLSAIPGMDVRVQDHGSWADAELCAQS